MQLGAEADGALLQRALDGQVVDDPDIADLVALADEVEALAQGRARPGPSSCRAATAPARRAGRRPPRDADCGHEGRQAGWVSSLRPRRCSCLPAGSVCSRAPRCRVTASIPSSSSSTGWPSRCPGDVGVGLAHLAQSSEHVAEGAPVELVAVAGRDAEARSGPRRAGCRRGLGPARGTTPSSTAYGTRGPPTPAWRCARRRSPTLRAFGRGRPPRRAAADRRRGGLAAAARGAPAGSGDDAARARGLRRLRRAPPAARGSRATAPSVAAPHRRPCCRGRWPPGITATTGTPRPRGPRPAPTDGE